MKTLRIIFGVLLIVFSALSVKAQNAPDMSKRDSSKIYIVIKNDGTTFTGRIISMDMHEVILRTLTLGDIAIPKHEIREIKEAKMGDMNKNGEYIQEALFPERYFYSTSAFSLPKGESYLLMTLWGPEYTYGFTDHLSIGGFTTWFPVPLIVGAKYSYDVNPKAHVAVGLDFLSGTWVFPGVFGVLPYGAITLGDRRNNITLSGGYGHIGGNIDFGSGIGNVTFSGGQGFLTLSGMAKLSRKSDFIFESYIVPVSAGQNSVTIYFIVPGIRLKTSENKSWQFGIGGEGSNGQFAPLPTIGYLVKL